jgi:Tol biopolymer transport system component
MVLAASVLLVAGTATIPSAAAANFPKSGEISFGQFDPKLGDFSIWVANPDGSHRHRLTSVPSFFSDWSPSGGRIAYDFVNSVGEHIATISPDGSGKRQITFGRGIQEVPRWSPDGHTIAYDASRKLPDEPGFATDIWKIHLAGSGAERLTHGGFDVEPVFSPDGRQIAFARIVKDADIPTVALYVMRSDGSQLRRLVPPTLGLEHPDWSPDGRWISFDIAPEVPKAAVRVVHPDGSGLHTLRPSDKRFELFKPAWAPDGRKLLVGCHDVSAGIDKLCVMNARGDDLHVVVASRDPVNFPAWGSHPARR